MHEFSNAEHEQIRKLAHQRWEERGGSWGSPDDDWFSAEQELIQRADSVTTAILAANNGAQES